MARQAEAVQRTRADIGMALIRLLATKPYEAISMADIAKEAYVSQRTVQRYYPSKDDVLGAALRNPAELLAEELSRRSAAESAEEAIGELVEAMFGVYNRYSAEIWTAYSRSDDVPELAEALRVVVEAWMSAIEGFIARWPDAWTIDQQLAKRIVAALTSYPTWRGFTGPGGFGSPEAELFITDLMRQSLLRRRGSESNQSLGPTDVTT